MLVYPYKTGSKSAKALSEAIGAKRIKHKNSKFKGSATKTVINWGSSDLPPEVMKCKVLNPPAKVALASNKRTFFNKLEEVNEEIRNGAHGDLAQPVSIPAHTTDKQVAGNWIATGSTVVCRTKLTGNSGDGIVIAETAEELVDAPLYTAYIPKKFEYRVHVVNGEVLHVQRKARNTDIPDDQINWKVRNHANGFIFAINEDHVPNPDVLQQGLNAVNALGLDFGAVDIIWNEKRKKAYVLEVNTACGLEGTTLEKYAEALS